MSLALMPNSWCALAGMVQALDHGLERHAARGMGLRIEEDLGMHHVVGCGALEVGQAMSKKSCSCSSTLAPA